MIRVLIVDDEPLAREGLRLLLAADPDVAASDEARSGREAIARIEAARPDLVLLDVQMPGIDGFGVVDQIGADRMALTTNVWTHVACVYDGKNLTVYVDGVKANADTTGGAVATGGMAGTGIGSQIPTQAQDNHYVGLIDNLRIWSVARARADICADAAPNCH